ncbi:VWA domain-containing protein [Rhizobium sp. TH2]|uniref:vWA domain-containing protein n=1 Tax=Rhizobium sp. TH2 TaxID=2775403 RepID=UPI0021574468|nr:pilus assembly protein [Rhizobium sp. TH2]UVC10382.1 VWA domain-containing protein [Rhizobium sp. TH2]
MSTADPEADFFSIVTGKVMKRFLKDRSGNFAILSAIVMVPLIISIGVAVEYRRAVNLRTMLQSSLDAGVLAGAKALSSGESQAMQAALDMFKADAKEIYDDGSIEALALKPTFTIADGIVSGAFSYPMKTPLLNIVSVKEVPVGVTSAADSGGSGVELAMVVDVSSSMEDDDKIKDLRKSAVALIDTLYKTAETRKDTWVSVVPFDGRVNVSDYSTGWIDKNLAPSNAGTNMNCTGLRSTTNRTSDALPEVEKFPPYLTGNNYGSSSTCGGTKVRGWSFEKTPIRNILLNLKTGYGTSIWEGAAWGHRMLSPKWKGRWGKADLPHDYGKGPPKVLILMTDGENTPGDYGDPFNTSAANLMQEATCAEMKKNGITIFAVAFDISDSAAKPLKNCASSLKHYFSSTTSVGMTEIFKQIGASLSTGKPRLVK